MIHKIQNFQSERSLYALRSKLALIASTLSFIKSSHRKSNQNQTSNFARLIFLLSLTKMSVSQPIAIIGSANAEILKSPNQKNATSSDETVVPILAPIITPIPFDNAITHAHVNASTNKDTRLLLWRRAVDRVPVKIELHGQFVYFPRILFSLLHHKNLIACSNVCIQKIKIHIPESKSQISNSMCLRKEGVKCVYYSSVSC